MPGVVLAVVLGLLMCSLGVAAQEIHTAEPWEGLADLVFDRSPPPSRPMQLQARQEETSASISSSGVAAPISTAAISTATSTGSSSLPTPFDSSLGNNFTSPSCPNFFRKFLSNDTLTDCLPLSLLLQTSNSFFKAERSPVLLAQTLDASCSANFTSCSASMASLANRIKDDSACGADLRMENPMVVQAYTGFLAYDTLYQAGCLTDGDGNYCFSNAVSNYTAPTSSYIYYLPLGVQLPAGTEPACNACLENTMQIFAQAAANDSLPLSDDYSSAAQMIDTACGPSFAIAVATTQQTNAAASLSAPPWTLGALVLSALVCGYLVG